MKRYIGFPVLAKALLLVDVLLQPLTPVTVKDVVWPFEPKTIVAVRVVPFATVLYDALVMVCPATSIIAVKRLPLESKKKPSAAFFA